MSAAAKAAAVILRFTYGHAAPPDDAVDGAMDLVLALADAGVFVTPEIQAVLDTEAAFAAADAAWCDAAMHDCLDAVDAAEQAWLAALAARDDAIAAYLETRPS